MKHVEPPRQRLVEILGQGKIFGQLPAEVLHDMAALLEIHQVQGGNVVYREGDAGDSMFFVLSGGLRVTRRGPGGELLLYNQIRAGESVGEVNVVLQQPRTADVVALRDSVLALLRRDHFVALLQRHPLLLTQAFVRAANFHLRDAPQPADSRHTQTFAVVPLHAGAPVQEVALALTRALAGLGRSHHVGPELGYEWDARQNAESGFSAWSDALELDNDFVIYQAEPGVSYWTRRAFRLADQVVFVAAASQVPQASEVLEALRVEPGYALKRAHLVVQHEASASEPQHVAGWREWYGFERIYATRHGERADFARLARFLAGRAVGVVLGGGGARGFAHLGVLRALQECGIPVDLIGGNSMGALLAAQFACGMELEQIRAQTTRFASGGERPVLPLVSLVSGERVARDLQRMFGSRSIESLWLPFFAAACNLSRGTTQVLDQGLLWRAVLASNSPAGLFPPVPLEGELLVDGAILENVPVAAMRTRLGVPLEKRRGNGTIIAVDVDVQEEMRVAPHIERLSAWHKLRHLWTRDAGAHRVPSIAEILYRAGHIGGMTQQGRTEAASDFYLRPPVKKFPLMGYKHSREIVAAGYRHAMVHIPGWKLAT